MIAKKGYDKSPTVYLYQATALAKLSQNHNYIDIQPNALDNSINTYSVYYELDKELGFTNNNEKLLSVLREVYAGKIDNSNTEGALVYLLNESKVVIKENIDTDSIKEEKDSIIIKTEPKTAREPNTEIIPTSKYPPKTSNKIEIKIKGIIKEIL